MKNLLKGALGHYDQVRRTTQFNNSVPFFDHSFHDRLDDIIQLANRYADQIETKAVLAWIMRTNAEREIRDVARFHLYQCSPQLTAILLYAGTLSADVSTRQESIEAFIDHCSLGAQERLVEIALNDSSLQLQSYALDLLAELNVGQAKKVADSILQSGAAAAIIKNDALRIIKNESQEIQMDKSIHMLTLQEKHQGMLIAKGMDTSNIETQSRAISELMRDADPTMQLIGALYFTLASQEFHPHVAKVCSANQEIYDLIIGWERSREITND